MGRSAISASSTSGSSPCRKKRRDIGLLGADRQRQHGGGHGLRQSLEPERADRLRLVVLGARDEDLAGARAVAQPPGDDHRPAEVVAAFAHGVAGGDSDPQLETVGGGGHGALHRMRAGDGVVGDVEHDHQPVAEALDLAAAVILDGLAQKGEVPAHQPVRDVVAHALEQLRGADDVGEERGDLPDAVAESFQYAGTGALRERVSALARDPAAIVAPLDETFGRQRIERHGDLPRPDEVLVAEELVQVGHELARGHRALLEQTEYDKQQLTPAKRTSDHPALPCLTKRLRKIYRNYYEVKRT